MSNKKAAGGTELMVQRLFNSLDEELMSNFQIIPTRLTESLDEKKIRILWCHDLADDPQLNYLANEGWRKFHLLVFVSNWQMQSFINKFKIPWSRCMVIPNAIKPIDSVQKPTDKIRLIYTPTPHRGLSILVPVFLKLLEKYPDLELDVFSSFKLYGWESRDKEFEPLFKVCEEHPSINYHGSQPNEVVREALQKAHIFAYPSIWQETSCLCLIEAMSAGLICVHPNLAALYETASNFTFMYQWNENINKHAETFYNLLTVAIDNVNSESGANQLVNQKLYVDQVHDWTNRSKQWEMMLTSMLNFPREFEVAKPSFVYNTERELK